jgi:ABC-type multidrug transport system permease subunit
MSAGIAFDLRSTWVLMRRALNEIARVPAAVIPAILAPTIFMCGLAAVFGNLTQLPGFTTDEYLTFILPVGFLQGAAFTGAATGVNLARDIELGWFDRLLASPAPRGVLLSGTVLSASLRVLMPITLLMVVGLSLGVSFPGLDGLLIAVVMASSFAAVAACYGVTLALKFKTQAAAPLMQAGVFMAVLFTTSYAPQALLTGWLYDVAKLNPVTQILEAVRQGFVGEVTWAETWPGLLCLGGLAVLMVGLAMRGLRRTGS